MVRPLQILAALAAAIVLSGAAQAQCLDAPGDLNASGDTDITDIQCFILTAISVLAGDPAPSCLAEPLDAADLNCDAEVNVVDVTIAIALVLNDAFPSTIDADDNLCADDCEAPACGDGICELGVESCETCADDCACPPTAFRLDTLTLVDPHPTINLFFCVDLVTGFLGDLVNDNLGPAVAQPGNVDFVTVFRPLSPGDASTPLDFYDGECTAFGCTTGVEPPFELSAFNQSSGTCFAPEPGTTTPGYDPPSEPSAPCFVSDELLFTVDVLGIQLPFEGSVISASYSGEPVSELVEGVIAGFLTEEIANSVLIPDDSPVAAGEPLSTLLLGASMNPCPGDDSDILNGVKGWWGYFNFTAVPVAWVE